MTDHTPGPWFVYDNRDLNGALWIGTQWFETHAEVRFGCDEAEEKGDLFANARLIAAAPDLLEALQEIAASHIPDQPAASEGDELAWAQRHVGALRRIAIRAIAKALPPNPAQVPETR